MSAPITDIVYAGAVRIDLDSTSLIILVLFTILFVTLRKLVFHPFLEDIDQRDERTVKMRESTEELDARAEQLKEEHRIALEAATQAAQEARRALRVEGLHHKEGHVDSAQEQAQANYQEQLEQLRGKFDGARTEALAQADDLARSIASKVLGRNIVWFLAVVGVSSFAFVPDAFAGGSGDSYVFDLINQSVSLVVLLGIIIYASGGKIKEGLKARSDELAQEINDAQEAHDQAQKLLDKYEGMIAQLQQDGESLLATYRQQGEEEKTRLIEEGEREADRIAKDAKRQIDNELGSMQRQIERELVETSLSRAEELINSKLNLTDHNRLTESYLNELEQPNRG
jgi:F-type H+-transporting ATPase subunit b